MLLIQYTLTWEYRDRCQNHPGQILHHQMKLFAFCAAAFFSTQLCSSRQQIRSHKVLDLYWDLSVLSVLKR